MKRSVNPARNSKGALNSAVISIGVRVKYILAGTIAFLTFLIYLPALQNDFVWDDWNYIVDNPFIRSLNGALLRRAFLDFYSFNWHPLTWISHALDYAIWGLEPMGHHLTNNILHAVNTFLVVLLVVRLIEAVPGKQQPASGQIVDRSGNNSSTHRLNDSPSRFTLIAAAVTGLLFGLHPIHVESVAWVAERKDLLCAFFFLLSIMFYLRYTGEISAQRAKGMWNSSWGRFALCFFILALLSKPMAVSLPFVLLILDWFPLKRVCSLGTFLSVSAEKVPFFLLSLISSALTLSAQKAGGAMALTEFVPFSTRILLTARSLIAYIWKMLLPLNLIPYYPYPRHISLLSQEYLFPAVLVAVITITCIGIARKHKLWLAVWSCYVVTLLPVLGIIQVGGQLMADRYTYLPSLGPFLIAGLITAELYETVHALKQWSSIPSAIGIIAAFAVLVLMSYITVQQISIWKSDIALWSSVIDMEPTHGTVAYQNRGTAFAKADRLDRAIRDYTTVITLEPLSHPEAYYNRGYAYYSLGRNDRAMEDFSTVILLNPNSAGAYFNRGIAQFKTGRKELAVSDFQKACSLGDNAGCNALQTIGSPITYHEK